MDGDNGVAVENNGLDMVKQDEVEELGAGMNMEKENDNNGTNTDSSPLNGTTEHSQKVESQNPPGMDDEASVVARESKIAKKLGTTAANGSKKDKTQKAETGCNGLATVSQKQRPHISQSLSFPAKGNLTSGLRKSANDIKLTKTVAKSSRPNGAAAVESSVSNGASTKQIKSSPAPGTRLPSVVKSCHSDATNKGHSSLTLRSTSPKAVTQHKSSTPIFASRLDERAEKRKEFFQKLEEKIQAKEMEITDLQAKSKESQEAEIKKLRKSLTFKATPMPTFYKEPGPPKVELKKIPTTRPVSPKLGRHKPLVTGTDAPEGSGPCKSLQQDLEHSKSDGNTSHVIEGSVDHKKPVRKSVSKLPSQKPTTAKVERKSPAPKAKVLEPEETDTRAKVEIEEKSNLHLEEFPMRTEGTEDSSVTNAVENGKSVVESRDPEIVPAEVPVVG